MVQTLTPNMQSPVMTTGKKSTGKQEISSVNLWRSAFHDAFKRLCPLRAGGHGCGCLPVLARMVRSLLECLFFLYEVHFFPV